MEIDGKDNTRGFIGKIKDSETGLSYIDARYLSGNQGKFYAIDPVSGDLTKLDIQTADPQSWNSYSYSRNNPIVLKDDDGKFWHIAIGGAIGAVVSGGITYWQTGDWHKTANAAIGGAVQGAMFAAVGPISLLASTATGAVSVAAGATLTRALDGEKIKASTIATDAGTGVIAGSIGYGVVKGGGKIMGSIGKSLGGVNKIGGLEVSKHAIERISERRVSESLILKALKNGERYLDDFRKNDLWVLNDKNSQKITVVTNIEKTKIVTIENFIPNLKSNGGKRFIKY